MEPPTRPLGGGPPPPPPRQPGTPLSKWLLAAAAVTAVAAALLVAVSPRSLGGTAPGPVGEGALAGWWWWWWLRWAAGAAAGTAAPAFRSSAAGGATPLRPPPVELVLTSRRVLVDGAVGPAALRLAGGVFAGVAVGDAVPVAWAGIPLVDVRFFCFLFHTACVGGRGRVLWCALDWSVGQGC